MTRSRSEYLRVDGHAPTLDIASEPDIRLARDGDRNALAELVLDAYRGTVDDEGEGFPEARQAVDDWLERRIAAASVVIEEGDRTLAMSFVVVVGGRAYIDPVAILTSRKQQGLGGRAVRASLHRLQQADHREVGAVITDGNVASARLFASLRAHRSLEPVTSKAPGDAQTIVAGTVNVHEDSAVAFRPAVAF